MSDLFRPRISVEQVEESAELAPKFDRDGLIPAVTTDYSTGELLMVGYMNAEALERTIQTGEAHYFSRSRQAIWHKGATSGLVQKVRSLLIDDDHGCKSTWPVAARVATSVIARVSTAGSRSAETRQWSFSLPRRKKSSIPRMYMVMHRTRRSFSPGISPIHG